MSAAPTYPARANLATLVIQIGRNPRNAKPIRNLDAADLRSALDATLAEHHLVRATGSEWTREAAGEGSLVYNAQVKTESR